MRSSCRLVWDEDKHILLYCTTQYTKIIFKKPGRNGFKLKYCGDFLLIHLYSAYSQSELTAGDILGSSKAEQSAGEVAKK